MAQTLRLPTTKWAAKTALTDRSAKPKLASGPTPIYAGDRVFVISSLAAELPWKSRPRYDELVSGGTVYTYVGNDPLDKTDPSGLCQTVDGHITGCDVKVEGLSTNKFVRFFQDKSVAGLTATIAKVGSAIQSNGSDGQKTAWSDVKTLSIHVGTYGGTKITAQSRSIDGGKAAPTINYWKPALSAGAVAQTVETTHDIFHGDAKFDADTRDFSESKNKEVKGRLESGVETDARGFLRSNSLIPPASEMPLCNPYLCEK